MKTKETEIIKPKKNETLSYSKMLKEVKSRCDELGISLIFDKLDNDGGKCKYRNKIYIVLNKLYDDRHRLKLFFNEISDTEYIERFSDIKEAFMNFENSSDVSA